MTPDIEERLAASGVLPEFQAALLHMLDIDAIAKSPSSRKTHEFFGQMYLSLGGTNNKALQSFLSAWHVLMTAILRLDHLQDLDPIELPLPSHASVGAQYNLVIGYYTLAWALLDEFGLDVSPQRIQRVRQLWGNLLLRASSGQQRDLMPTNNTANVLDVYQEVVRAKAGAFYALAFGSIAALAVDDPIVIKAFVEAGEIFGMLEQLNDDLVDAKDQTTEYTLLRAYQIAVQHAPTDLPPFHLRSYWQYICRNYFEYLQHVIMPLSENSQLLINNMFRSVFKFMPIN